MKKQFFLHVKHSWGCRIIACCLTNLQLIPEFIQKNLMLVCAQVSNFVSSISCVQYKFYHKIHSKWEMWILRFQQKLSTDAEDSQECLQ